MFKNLLLQNNSAGLNFNQMKTKHHGFTEKSVFVQIKGYTPFLWEDEKEIWKMKNLFSRTTANFNQT